MLWATATVYDLQGLDHSGWVQLFNLMVLRLICMSYLTIILKTCIPTACVELFWPPLDFSKKKGGGAFPYWFRIKYLGGGGCHSITKTSRVVCANCVSNSSKLVWHKGVHHLWMLMYTVQQLYSTRYIWLFTTGVGGFICYALQYNAKNHFFFTL